MLVKSSEFSITELQRTQLRHHGCAQKYHTIIVAREIVEQLFDVLEGWGVNSSTVTSGTTGSLQGTSTHGKSELRQALHRRGCDGIVRADSQLLRAGAIELETARGWPQKLAIES
eukprot:963867-Pyramimonas_sp.AAC.1